MCDDALQGKAALRGSARLDMWYIQECYSMTRLFSVGEYVKGTGDANIT